MSVALLTIIIKIGIADYYFHTYSNFLYEKQDAKPDVHRDQRMEKKHPYKY
jgi:hypothetical protein